MHADVLSIQKWDYNGECLIQTYLNKESLKVFFKTPSQSLALNGNHSFMKSKQINKKQPTLQGSCFLKDTDHPFTQGTNCNPKPITDPPQCINYILAGLTKASWETGSANDVLCFSLGN